MLRRPNQLASADPIHSMVRRFSICEVGQITITGMVHQWQIHEWRKKMLRIVGQSDVADQIRRSEGQIEFVDEHGKRVGAVRRPPTVEEIDYVKVANRLQSAESHN